MFVHQGLGLWWTGGGAVSSGMPTPWKAEPIRKGWTEGFLNIGRAPWCILIMLACVLFAFIFLNYTKHGRYLYAMGEMCIRDSPCAYRRSTVQEH